MLALRTGAGFEFRYGPGSFVRHLAGWMDANPPLVGVNWASMLELAFRNLALDRVHVGDEAAELTRAHWVARRDAPSESVWIATSSAGTPSRACVMPTAICASSSDRRK